MTETYCLACVHAPKTYDVLHRDDAHSDTDDANADADDHASPFEDILILAMKDILDIKGLLGYGYREEGGGTRHPGPTDVFRRFLFFYF